MDINNSECLFCLIRLVGLRMLVGNYKHNNCRRAGRRYVIRMASALLFRSADV